MLLLFETSSGYALFKIDHIKDTKKFVEKLENLQDTSGVLNQFKLKNFVKFSDVADALSSTIRVNEGKLNKHIKSIVKKCILQEYAQEALWVEDTKLASLIKDKYNIDCSSSNEANELMRAVRFHQKILLPDLLPKDANSMTLALAHSISRYRLKFSADKIDTMIIQAISLLDDLDKELNNYMMRCREWYGWHFPELGNIVSDNQTYIQVVHRLQFKHNAVNCDLSDIISESLQTEVQCAAEVSMGTEISGEDMENIIYLCEQVIEMNKYRSQLSEYLQNRIRSIAPNLTVLVGEFVAARLIAHAGSLTNLAKHPSSTIQIIGAEKALFRALKSHSTNTPKYGLIYHASIISQTSAKLKGKASRMLAAKAALATRFDALSEEEVNNELAVQYRVKLEQRLRALEEQSNRSSQSSGRFQQNQASYKPNKGAFRNFNPQNDMLLPSRPLKRPPDVSYEQAFGHKKRKANDTSTE